MKLLSILIAYFPDKNDIFKNIDRFINDVDMLIIWDNTPPDKIEWDLNELCTKYDGKIILMTSGSNEFIAYPLNEAIHYGQRNGYTHLLTMDQDSLLERDAILNIKNIINSHNDNQNIYSPHIIDCSINPQTTNSSISDTNHNYLSEVNQCITSGTIYPIDELIKTCGERCFNEDYKIDYVDFEICYKFAKSGHKSNYSANQRVTQN